MRCAIIENERIVNAIEAEPGFLGCIEFPVGAEIGWELVDGVWVAPKTPAPIAPQEVSIREACQALEQAGLLDDIEAAIAAAPRSVQIDWQRATTVRRDWPTLLQVQQLMGLTDQQIDDLFTLASTL